ncbi:MAG: hypothetical protein IJ868_05230 [Prevotella sp.]|nr:hypothetical protein [Prevotella sp.]
MNHTITLTLVKSLIMESVKNETFFRGQVVKAADGKAVTEVYHEQAGNEQYQERLLQRALYTNLGDLKTHLSDYLSTSGQSAADNNIYSEEDGDHILLHLTVSDRFNKGYTDTLAKLCGKYVEEAMLVDWWKPINEKQCAVYTQFLEKDLAAIKRCFNKTAPAAPTVPYTTKLRTTGSSICIGPGEVATVTYELSDGAIDDIEIRIEDNTLIDAGRSEQGFTVIGKLRGHTYIELYSRHNPDVARAIHVYVTDQS